MEQRIAFGLNNFKLAAVEIFLLWRHAEEYAETVVGGRRLGHFANLPIVHHIDVLIFLDEGLVGVHCRAWHIAKPE
mgnify:FL=1